MTTLTATLVDRDGSAEPVGTAASNGDKFLNTGREYVVFLTGGAQRVVTVTTPYQLDGLAVGPRTITVPANSFVIAGPFPPLYHNDGSGFVVLNYDNVSGIAVGVIKVQQL